MLCLWLCSFDASNFAFVDSVKETTERVFTFIWGRGSQLVNRHAVEATLEYLQNAVSTALDRKYKVPYINAYRAYSGSQYDTTSINKPTS